MRKLFICLSRVTVLATVIFLFTAAQAGTTDPLAARVTIYRDLYGVPHIVAEDEPAVFFGYGYAQAQDHLERMMLQYRDAQGRRAEVQGEQALGDNYLHFIPYEYRWDGDYLQRLLRTKRGVLEHRAQMDRHVYQLLDAFARGVNAYIAEHRSQVPAWIDAITAEDVEALERSQYFRFYSIHDALNKLTKQPTKFPALGSNQWAVEPGKSADGHIMHVEHTHMPWANRFQNYEAHLIVPGKLYAAGISWFGSPFFLDGFNDRISWSATWNEPNMADVYEEQLNPTNSLQYLYEDKWLPVKLEHETARVKSDHGFKEVPLNLYYTHHGPIVMYEPENHRAFSVKLPNFDGVNYSLGLYGLMKSRNLREFKSAVARQLMPRWNLLFTDAKDIYWVHNGNVARRSEKYDWSKPVPGTMKETEWGPFIPFSQYPQSLNPASGFLQNCNNPYWVCTRDSGLNPLGPAPYYLKNRPSAAAGEEALNTRGERVFQVLTQSRRFTLDDMIRLGFDTHIMAAEAIVPLLLETAKAQPPQTLDSRFTAAVETLRGWDFSSSTNSTAFSYIYYWGKAYRDLFGDKKFGRFNSPSRQSIDIHDSEEQRMALEAMKTALDRLENRFHKTSVPWGSINIVKRGGEFPLEGADTFFDPLHVDEGQEGPDGRIYCNDGWGHLLVIREGNPKQIWSLLPYGESEDPASPHFNDQAKLHSQSQVKPFWFYPGDILGHVESVWGQRDRLARLRRKLPSRLFDR
ncbi:MAG TPA: penicillin acylase family protein [Patescibacteria group bacterium]|nr:penicillin acylase family protein [Patescibacteria group bacterium]